MKITLRDNQGRVFNIIEAESAERAALFYPDYSASLASDTDTLPERNVAGGSSITPSEFRDRFTKAEIAKVLELAYANTGDPNIQYILLLLQTTNSNIDVTDYRTVQGVTYLVGKAITEDRVPDILKRNT